MDDFQINVKIHESFLPCKIACQLAIGYHYMPYHVTITYVPVEHSVPLYWDKSVSSEYVYVCVCVCVCTVCSIVCT